MRNVDAILDKRIKIIQIVQVDVVHPGDEMKVSATEEYGLRCLMRLAVAWGTGEFMTIPQVARLEGLSPQHVAKLVSILRRAGLVRSVRGMNGGVGLSRSPKDVTMTEALSALAGTPVRTGPCIGPSAAGCEMVGTCGLRNVWCRISDVVTGVLDGVTLADLVMNGRPGAAGLQQNAAIEPARWGSGTRG